MQKSQESALFEPHARWHPPLIGTRSAVILKEKKSKNHPAPKQLLINLNTNYSAVEQSDELFRKDFWEEQGDEEEEEGEVEERRKRSEEMKGEKY